MNKQEGAREEVMPDFELDLDPSENPFDLYNSYSDSPANGGQTDVDTLTAQLVAQTYGDLTAGLTETMTKAEVEKMLLDACRSSVVTAKNVYNDTIKQEVDKLKRQSEDIYVRQNQHNMSKFLESVKDLYPNPSDIVNSKQFKDFLNSEIPGIASVTEYKVFQNSIIAGDFKRARGFFSTFISENKEKLSKKTKSDNKPTTIEGNLGSPSVDSRRIPMGMSYREAVEARNEALELNTWRPEDEANFNMMYRKMRG